MSESPARARPASTVVLARPAPAGPEVLLLQRPSRSVFAPGAWVFPGGVVDRGDGAAEAMDGAEAQRWAGRLGLADPAEAAAYVVAALREAWEETGILVAHGAPGPGPRDGRRTLPAGERPFPARVAEAGARLATEDLLYIAHWITPESEPRRYDTRFFLARVEPDARCELCGEELADSCWLRPQEALDRHRAGEMRMLLPTRHTLRRLAPFASLEEAWEALRAAPVPTYLPPRPEEGEVWELVEQWRR